MTMIEIFLSMQQAVIVVHLNASICAAEYVIISVSVSPMQVREEVSSHKLSRLLGQDPVSLGSCTDNTDGRNLIQQQI